MKKIVFILISLVFIGGCSDANTDSSNTSKVNTEIATLPSESEATSPEPLEIPLSSYDDGIICCKYDDSVLSSVTLSKNPNFSSGIVFAAHDADTNTAITNGSCVYTAVTPAESAYLFSSNGADLTKAFLGGVFGASESETPSVSESNGTFHYQITRPGITCKGMVSAVSNDSLAFAVYLVSDSESPELVNAFDECYESISFTPVQTSNSDTDFDALLKDAEKAASEATPLTSGDIYDSATAIYPNISITDMKDNVSFSIYLTHVSLEDDSVNFFHIVDSICKSCKLEDSYSSVSFSLMVDDSLVATLVLVDYSSPSSFSSAEPSVCEEKYKPYFDYIYSTLYSSYDISNKFDADLDELSKKYGISK